MASSEPAATASSTAPTTHSETTPMAGTTAQTGISLRTPSKYLSDKSTSSTTKANPFVSPPADWLYGTWTVTHSTLSMWRSAQNVRITYKPLPASSSSPASSTPDIDDLVEYEKKGTENGSIKSVAGIDKPDPSHPGAWDWRGKGWLKFVSSHWEVLGWGERPLAQGGVERWVVTWFAPTLFTKEGVDFYSDRKEGLSAATAEELTAALKALDAPKVVELAETEMRSVEVKLPWSTKS